MGAHLLLRYGHPGGGDYIGHLYIDGGADGDRWFIIRAVNAHDELVAALTLARDELERIAVEGGYGTSAGVDERIDAALAKAEAPNAQLPSPLGLSPCQPRWHLRLYRLARATQLGSLCRCPQLPNCRVGATGIRAGG